jgi:hypothetical protein
MLDICPIDDSLVIKPGEVTHHHVHLRSYEKELMIKLVNLEQPLDLQRDKCSHDRNVLGFFHGLMNVIILLYLNPEFLIQELVMVYILICLKFLCTPVSSYEVQFSIHSCGTSRFSLQDLPTHQLYRFGQFHFVNSISTSNLSISIPCFYLYTIIPNSTKIRRSYNYYIIYHDIPFSTLTVHHSIPWKPESRCT